MRKHVRSEGAWSRRRTMLGERKDRTIDSAVIVDLKHRETAPRSTVAEASRPARQITKKIKAKSRDPSGRKKKNSDRPAKYVNWSTPFAWSAIVAAQRKVGWGYTNIVQELRRVNYDFFQYLKPHTVMGWIVNVGGFSQWSPAVLARADKGNIPGHNKGGRHGILVRNHVTF
ncbi:hypothetical protein GGX14DRAFT_385775 [Mycena pura]|uniref:Uncharacterized protein n=1 Tax=Mycena pura TaxID=153505 RepID=A0AAD6YR85_9AGAR|nr:hypothetical protein GGX14DRAFT_409323 [Mycena pura]KAJ7227001.1 hypothetical protein GGX14DRAFT_385775 [Mycena pura]